MPSREEILLPARFLTVVAHLVLVMTAAYDLAGTVRRAKCCCMRARAAVRARASRRVLPRMPLRARRVASKRGSTRGSARQP